MTDEQLKELQDEEQLRRSIADTLHADSVDKADIGMYADAEIHKAYADGMRRVLEYLP